MRLGNLPKDPIVYIILILAVLIAVVVAIALGRSVDFTVKPLRLRFKRKDNTTAVVAVATDAKIDSTEIDGDVVGVDERHSGAQGTPVQESVSVLDNAQLKSSNVQGDVIGVRRTTESTRIPPDLSRSQRKRHSRAKRRPQRPRLNRED